ncbi:MAG TPA: peptidoglycan-binding protein [Candidatus Pullichristensenella excrementigallinarum]|uniref:Peptidoglycan-binding protein n=1 Tax=Candidatus Pullichristensenella excrementigallinarum TaxID=2840907 RepID=A0A9D1IAN1_9FIRM|nr:peptidoglycan-binding protein [Candidatus Pullichristensenella excrementigallinarum]
MPNRVKTKDFIAFLEWALNNKCGYIMGSYGQDPKKWPENSFWFTQYSGKQRQKALFWRKTCPAVFDCNGLAEGCYQKLTGVNINTRARNNFSQWCSNSGVGKIPAKLRVPGAAVFVHNGSYISHVGYLWKPVDAAKPEGDWWVIEAKGVMYGVVQTKLSAGRWNRYGWMTKYFDYGDDTVPPEPLPLGAQTLQLGSTGGDVKDLQLKLLAWGYNLGKWGADGEYGKATSDAVSKFQVDQGIPVTGLYDAATHQKLVEKFEQENAPA